MDTVNVGHLDNAVFFADVTVEIAAEEELLSDSLHLLELFGDDCVSCVQMPDRHGNDIPFVALTGRKAGREGIGSVHQFIFDVLQRKICDKQPQCNQSRTHEKNKDSLFIGTAV